MDAETVGVIIFLMGQLLLNISVLAHMNTRVTRIETHLIHVLNKYGYKVREEDEG